jgi:hypothetical protein
MKFDVDIVVVSGLNITIMIILVTTANIVTGRQR